MKKSIASRISMNGTPRAVRLAVGQKPGHADVLQLSLLFDLGSKDRHEHVMLIIDPADFSALLDGMTRVDREGVIAGFAAAVLRHEV